MKKGTRICAAGLLAMTMALGSAPVLGVMTSTVALAAEQTVTVSDDLTVSVKVEADHVYLVKSNGNVTAYDKASAATALDAARDGDTILFGEGKFDCSGKSALGYKVTIKGMGAGKTILTNAAFATASYDYSNDDEAAVISVSDLTMVTPGEGQTAVTINSSTEYLTLNMSNVEFSGYKYAFYTEGAKGTTVNATNVKMTNVWTVAAIQDGSKIKLVNNISFADGSSYLYAAQAWSGSRNTLYTTFDAYNADTDKAENTLWDPATKQEATPQFDTDAKGYVCVATNGDYKYTDADAAIAKAASGDIVTLTADATLNGKVDINKNDVTIDGQGHVLTAKNDSDPFKVTADNFVLENTTLVGQNTTAKLLYVYNTATPSVDVTLKNVTLDNRAGSGMALSVAHGNVVIEGQFNVISGLNATAGVELQNISAGTSSLKFASDATVAYNDLSGAGKSLVSLIANNKVFPTVTSDNAAIGVPAADEDGYVNVHMHNWEVKDASDATAEEDGYTGDKVCTVCGETIKGETIPATGYNTVVVYRLYNPYSTEHLYTANKSEYDLLCSIGWKGEGESFTTTDKKENAVYRLCNPYTGEHFFTTNVDEYNSLGEAGWSQEGIAWYGADSEAEGAVEVYRLFNPYASFGTHLFTTDADEVANLVKLGWNDEGVAWYGQAK